MAALARSLTTTFFLVAGLALVVLGYLLHKYPGLVPGFVQPIFNALIPHLPYFVVAWGLFFLGHARNMVAREYNSAQRKNRQFPHAWKIPLIATQAFILQFVGFIYGLSVGLGWAKPITSLLGLLFLLLLFFAYVLWYAISHIQHHFPSIAALRVATIVALPLAGLSLFFWVGVQLLLPSLLLGLFALAAALASLGISTTKPDQQKALWLQVICLAVTIGLLAPVAYGALPLGSRVDLVGLGLIASGKGMEDSKVEALSYSPDSKKIAVSLKSDSGCSVLVEKSEPTGNKLAGGADELTIVSYKAPAGEEAVRPVFVAHGRYFLIDAVKNGQRGIWRVNSETGSTVSLRESGVEPFGDGFPWSPQKGLFLYVSRAGEGYRLNSLNPLTNQSKVLMRSENPIFTPSWSPNGKEVSYADGVQGFVRLFDLKTKERDGLMSGVERAEGDQFKPEGTVQEAIPAPDGFRYLYVTKKGKTTAVWAIRADGTHRDKLYETRNIVKKIAWNPDAQKIVFEEKLPDLWFLSRPSCVKILDANVGPGVVQNLIPSQISNFSPSVSSDGVKIAFAASEGLWYPSFGQGVWVAVLR